MILEAKLQLSEDDITMIKKETKGFVWLVMDIKKHIMVAGDEHFSKLKRVLYDLRSRSSHIWGVGLDMDTGAIYPKSPVNRKIYREDSSTQLPDEVTDELVNDVQYFFGFGNLPNPTDI